MIKKLQKKIIAVIVIITTLITLVIFSILLFLFHSNMEDRINQRLEKVMMDGQKSTPPPFTNNKEPMDIPRETFILVTLNSDNQITQIFPENENYNISRINTTLEGIFSKGSERDTIDNYNYLIKSFNSEKKIALIDTSYERNTFQALVALSIGAITLTLIIISIISYILSKWLTKPIAQTLEGQKQFIANASHELKTPLAVIRTNSEVIKSDDPHNPWIQAVIAETYSMDQMIQQMLELAKYDYIKQLIESKHFDLSLLLEEILTHFNGRIFQKNIHLEKEIEASIIMKGDQDKTKKVIEAILDNAVKYTPDYGTITIQLFFNTNIQLYIRNSDTYLTDEMKEKVFERFTKGNIDNKQPNSFGLGLSIAKELMVLMEGNIEAYSSKNEGTTFKITFKKS